MDAQLLWKKQIFAMTDVLIFW